MGVGRHACGGRDLCPRGVLLLDGLGVRSLVADTDQVNVGRCVGARTAVDLPAEVAGNVSVVAVLERRLGIPVVRDEGSADCSLILSVEEPTGVVGVVPEAVARVALLTDVLDRSEWRGVVDPALRSRVVVGERVELLARLLIITIAVLVNPQIPVVVLRAVTDLEDVACVSSYAEVDGGRKMRSTAAGRVEEVRRAA